MFGGTLCHCSLFTWALVDFTTKGHKMGLFVLTRPCLHLSSMVVWPKSHECYTLCALSTITGRVGASLLCCSPPLSGFFIFPRIIHGSLCVCTVVLRGFHRWRELALAFPVLVTVKTLISIGLRVDIGHWRGLSGLLLGYCWMVVYCRQKMGYKLAQLVIWKSCCVIKMNDPSFLLG